MLHSLKQFRVSIVQNLLQEGSKTGMYYVTLTIYSTTVARIRQIMIRQIIRMSHTLIHLLFEQIIWHKPLRDRFSTHSLLQCKPSISVKKNYSGFTKDTQS